MNPPGVVANSLIVKDVVSHLIGCVLQGSHLSATEKASLKSHQEITIYASQGMLEETVIITI